MKCSHISHCTWTLKQTNIDFRGQPLHSWSHRKPFKTRGWQLTKRLAIKVIKTGENRFKMINIMIKYFYISHWLSTSHGKVKLTIRPDFCRDMWLRKSSGLWPQENMAGSGREYGFLWLQRCCCLRQQPTVAASGRKSKRASQWATQKWSAYQCKSALKLVNAWIIISYGPIGWRLMTPELDTWPKRGAIIMCMHSYNYMW